MIFLQRICVNFVKNVNRIITCSNGLSHNVREKLYSFIVKFIQATFNRNSDILTRKKFDKPVES